MTEIAMKRAFFVLFFLATTGLVASAAGQAPAPKYKAPRTATGHPDLQGVWNFSTAAPMQRPAAFATKKVFTKEEFDARRSMMKNALGNLGKIAPVEDV